MNLSEYKSDTLVTVKDESYGWFKTLYLITKGEGPQLVRVLHSTTYADWTWNLALARTFKLEDVHPL